jgi:hypothetical protein
MAWLHLAVLWSFAFAQPLFGVLADSPEFFVARGNTSGDIILLAVAVTVLPPTLLIAVEAMLVKLPRVREGLHLGFVAILTAAFALQLLGDALDGSSEVLIPVAAAAGAAAAAAYARTRWARAVLTVLSPAPVVFLVAFLVVSPVSKLAFPSDVEVSGADVTSRTPVVVVVFDELPSASLMNARKAIDASRYPHFAALARTSTWYRNATTVASSTIEAVPAILTGRYPGEDELPIASDHPGNLFTLLGEDYSLHVSETATALCPERLCGDSAQALSAGERQRELVSDLSVVSLHLLLPDDLRSTLPSVDRAFGDFWDEGRDEPGVVASGDIPDIDLENRTAKFGRFLHSLKPHPKRPPLHFFHSALPHVPYEYLPTGHQYAIAGPATPGLVNEVWRDDSTVVHQGQQRYLLQLGHVDRLLGRLISRLRAARLWQRSLVVVTADHGVSFQPGGSRRYMTASNLGEIAGVPLLIKAPGQRSGKVDDSAARTIDIVPTIADHLGARLSWTTNGRSLRTGPGRPPDRPLPFSNSIQVLGFPAQKLSFGFSDFTRLRDKAVDRMVRLFGSGNGLSALFAHGDGSELVGRRVASLERAPDADARVELDLPQLLVSVDPGNGLVPTFISGRVTGPTKSRERLAVAVNGVIRAVTTTFRDGDETRVAAMVPLSSLKRRSNVVGIFAFGGNPRRLALLSETGGETYELTSRAGRQTIVSATGREFRVVPEAVRGSVDVVKPEEGTIVGWAAVPPRKRVADRVLVFSGERFLLSGRPSLRRSDVADVFNRGVLMSGFKLHVVAAEKDFRRSELHVFGLAGRRASELPRADAG